MVWNPKAKPQSEADRRIEIIKQEKREQN